MIMSNFIDEAERHAELYNAFTPRQRFVLALLEAAKQSRAGQEGIRSALSTHSVTQSEIHWLERTGRLAPDWVPARN